MLFRQQMINGQETLFGNSWLNVTDPTWMADMLQYLYQGSPMRGQQRYIPDVVSPMRGQQNYMSDTVSPMRGQQHFISKNKSPMRGWELKNLVKVTYYGTLMRSEYAR
jgi:hypothetical protein